MSAEKVRRYVFTGEPGGVGVGMRGDLLVNDPAHPVALNRTEYIGYADVAALVEALRDAERGKWVIDNAAWIRRDGVTVMEITLPEGVNLSSWGCRRYAIDRARGGE